MQVDRRGVLSKVKTDPRASCFESASKTASQKTIRSELSMGSSRSWIWNWLAFKGMHPETTGRPGYHPATLLEIYLYGHLDRIQSSRRLERETQRNVEPIWPTGRLTPDFKTSVRLSSRPKASTFTTLSHSLRLTVRSVRGSERTRQHPLRLTSTAAISTVRFVAATPASPGSGMGPELMFPADRNRPVPFKSGMGVH